MPPPSPVVNTIEGFDPTVHPEAAAALAAAEAWRAEYDAGMSGRWVSFIGKSGTGKTMLAKATVAGIRQPMPIFREWSAVCNWLARGEWDITGLLKFQPVLILDEITQPYDSDELSKFDLKTKKALFEIISARVGRWTIITDNKTLREISQFETRIASRMLRPGADGRPSVVCEFRECPDFWAARRVRA